MLLFRWLEAKNILHDALAANTQPRRQEPPLLYNSPLEPLVASNCKGIMRLPKRIAKRTEAIQENLSNLVVTNIDHMQPQRG